MEDLLEARITKSIRDTEIAIKKRAYIAVFVCLTVKDIHVELVNDLTSEGFIAALKRFIARRGLCKAIYSDNERNFVGANNELQELQELIKPDDYNQRSLWEAAVKSLKHHLARVVGIEPFTLENFNTLTIEIESILNYLPLTPISSDPNDLIVLTPGHFLIGDSLTSLRERNFVHAPTDRPFLETLAPEYLNKLTKRSKWTRGLAPPSYQPDENDDLATSNIVSLSTLRHFYCHTPNR
ncbi:uncharacterized protein LOC143431004 [Xylocopa sonorina]|uniref:uncharacterized protein LOC143431004 n=1 Tax=Xylocopa sonorina TaxID=1818115 RepID=UPI00403AD659